MPIPAADLSARADGAWAEFQAEPARFRQLHAEALQNLTHISGRLHQLCEMEAKSHSVIARDCERVAGSDDAPVARAKEA